MGRRKEFDPTEFLDRAMREFWHRGYEATSIDDLVMATGVNRASLYGTFGDKAALFRACLDRYAEQIVTPWLTAMAEGDSSAVPRFLRTLAAYAASDPKRQGCLMVNTAVETVTHDAEVLAAIRNHFARLEGAFAKALTDETAERTRSQARLALCVAVGLLVLGKAGIERGTLEDAAAAGFIEAPRS
jgi:TetR/AcrR family transcriptional regulator, transcriptional repressor for nem operon